MSWTRDQIDAGHQIAKALLHAPRGATIVMDHGAPWNADAVAAVVEHAMPSPVRVYGPSATVREYSRQGAE